MVSVFVFNVFICTGPRFDSKFLQSNFYIFLTIGLNIFQFFGQFSLKKNNAEVTHVLWYYYIWRLFFLNHVFVYKNHNSNNRCNNLKNWNHFCTFTIHARKTWKQIRKWRTPCSMLVLWHNLVWGGGGVGTLNLIFNMP